MSVLWFRINDIKMKTSRHSVPIRMKENFDIPTEVLCWRFSRMSIPSTHLPTICRKCHVISIVMTRVEIEVSKLQCDFFTRVYVPLAVFEVLVVSCCWVFDACTGGFDDCPQAFCLDTWKEKNVIGVYRHVLHLAG